VLDAKIVSAILISVILGSMIGFGLSYAVFNSQIQSLRKDFVYTKVEIEGILSKYFMDILPNTRTVFARWNLTWLLVLESGEWGASVGNSTWGAVFDYDFGTNAIFGSYTDLVGFRATMTINMQRDGPVHFVIGSDDGSELRVDGEVWIDNWGTHGYREMSVTRNLSKGNHTLTLWYFDWNADARVSFNCDPDILVWNP